MINKEAIVDCVKVSFPDVQSIYLFGSAGTQYERADSDVDIAILPSRSLSGEELLALINQLAKVVACDHIDLVDLSVAATVIIFQVITMGDRIYSYDDNACEYFESIEFSKYVRLNESRAAILEDIKKRGSVYGQ